MSKKAPPIIISKFLAWFCPIDLFESIIGDLTEQFEEDYDLLGSTKAKWIFTWNVLRFCRPGIILRNKSNTQYNQIAMFRNYFKIAYRNMLRYKFFTLINMLGLSIGIAMSLFIVTHIVNELSYETNFKDHQKIYRIASDVWAKLPPKLSTQLKSEMPEIDKIGRLYYLNPKVMVHENDQILVDKPFFADESIIDIFNLEFIEGNPVGSLDDHYDIVLTESMANRFFKPGDTRIGEIIQFFGTEKYHVTGIIKDLPKNSHLKIDCLASIVDTWVSNNQSTRWSAVSIYTKVNSEQKVDNIRKKLPEFQVNFSNDLNSMEELVADGDFYRIHPITDIHLNSHREKETEKNSDVTLIYIFGTLVVFILLVVIINFINLYVSQTLNRLREIGIRKVMGAHKRQLIIQFLSEAFLIVLVSSAIALLIIYLTLPYYNQLTNVQLALGDLLATKQLYLFFGIIILVTLLAGGYPALYLSKFNIDQGLRTKELKAGKKFSLKTVMVAVQFLISICLLTATIIVNRQMNFIHSKDLGFNQEEVIAIKLHGKLWYEAVNHNEKVRNELLKHSDVKQLSISSKAIGDRFGLEPFSLVNQPEKEEIGARYIRTDSWFLETMGIKIKEGNYAPKSFNGFQYIVNELTAENLQENDLIGQTVKNNEGSEGKLRAIVENFHFASLHNEVEPLVILMNDDKRFADYLLVRIDTKDLKSTMNKIETSLQSIAPGSLMISFFLNDKIENLYRTERNLFTSFQIFTVTIIILACLGLFALFAFVVQTRKKELGIRKTLGASFSQLLINLSKSYLLILVGTIIMAIPITWYFSTDWLSNFAFQTKVDWWYYVIPGIFILLLASIAMISQSWSVANSNPVDSLRDE